MLKSIVCTYPDFRMLPKGLKQLLVASENLFFSESQAAAQKSEEQKPAGVHLWQSPQAPHFAGRRVEHPAPSRAFQWDYWAE